MQADMGTKVSPVPIEKLTMAAGQKLLCGILSKKIRIVKLHFRQGIGYVHCFDGVCCEMGGIPSVRYVFPLIGYNCDLAGNLIKEPDKMTLDDVFFRLLALGKDDYENILTKQSLQERQGSDITKVDLLITCTDSDYQKKDFDIAGPAVWRKVLQKEQYVHMMQFFHSKAEISLARQLDEQGFLKALELAANVPMQDRPAVTDLQKGQKALTSPSELPTKVLEEEIDFDEMFEEDTPKTAQKTEKKDDDIPF